MIDIPKGIPPQIIDLAEKNVAQADPGTTFIPRLKTRHDDRQ
jgi:hypothetical protein